MAHRSGSGYRRRGLSDVATDMMQQKSISVEIQRQAFQDVPYYPLGLAYFPTAYRADLRAVPNGIPASWSVRRS